MATKRRGYMGRLLFFVVLPLATLAGEPSQATRSGVWHLPLRRRAVDNSSIHLSTRRGRALTTGEYSTLGMLQRTVLSFPFDLLLAQKRPKASPCSLAWVRTMLTCMWAPHHKGSPSLSTREGEQRAVSESPI